jgi:hypothetical protein
MRTVPALSSKISQGDEKASSHCESHHYSSIIGKLNFLEKSTRLDIAHAIHHCATVDCL